MPFLINQYSFIIMTIVVLVITGVLTWRFLDPRLSIAAILVMLLVLGAVFFSTRTKDNSVSSLEEFNLALASGKPVFVELYSDF